MASDASRDHREIQIGLQTLFNQDACNLPHVHAGLQCMKQPFVSFGEYGETKLRHYCEMLEKWIRKA